MGLESHWVGEWKQSSQEKPDCEKRKKEEENKRYIRRVLPCRFPSEIFSRPPVTPYPSILRTRSPIFYEPLFSSKICSGSWVAGSFILINIPSRHFPSHTYEPLIMHFATRLALPAFLAAAVMTAPTPVSNPGLTVDLKRDADPGLLDGVLKRDASLA